MVKRALLLGQPHPAKAADKGAQPLCVRRRGLTIRHGGNRRAHARERSAGNLHVGMDQKPRNLALSAVVELREGAELPRVPQHRMIGTAQRVDDRCWNAAN